MQDLKVDYNEEPVFYCASCLSLAVRKDGDIEYCDDCGVMDFKETDIEDWEKLYSDKYKGKHIEKSFNYLNNPRLFLLLEERRNKIKK